MYKLMLILKK